MKHIQTVADLFNKAVVKGEAKVNGRMSYEWGIKGDLEEKYYISIINNILTMRHWGTETLKLDMISREVLSYYGESNSDRDSLNTILMETGTQGKFRYLPSKDLFIYEAE